MHTENSYFKVIGFQLKTLRKEAGLTSFQLAKLAQIKSEQQMYRYERGVNKIGVDELIRVLHVLNVDIGEFFTQFNEAAYDAQLLNINNEGQLITHAVKLVDEINVPTI